VSGRYQVRQLAADDLGDAAVLLAERHKRHRQIWPALDARFEDPVQAAPLITELFLREGASGAIVHAGSQPAAFVLGTRRDSSWGANVWVEDAGSAGSDPDAIRLAYASAAARWADEGRTKHYAVVPATDAPIVEAWFRLSFGLQHVHALREGVAADFQPAAQNDVVVRPARHADMARLVELDVVLPSHSGTSPIFSPLAIPMPHESRQEIEQDLTDPRFTPFVAEHAGRIIGTATAASLEVSNSNSRMMRPPSCGFLGFAVVDPESRGLGAGRALADAVLTWSRDQGYPWVATDWRSTNLEADRTWRAAGFRPTFYRLFRAIA